MNTVVDFPKVTALVISWKLSSISYMSDSFDLFIYLRLENEQFSVPNRILLVMHYYKQ